MAIGCSYHVADLRTQVSCQCPLDGRDILHKEGCQMSPVASGPWCAHITGRSSQLECHQHCHVQDSAGPKSLPGELRAAMNQAPQFESYSVTSCFVALAGCRQQVASVHPGKSRGRATFVGNASAAWAKRFCTLAVLEQTRACRTGASRRCKSAFPLGFPSPRPANEGSPCPPKRMPRTTWAPPCKRTHVS